MLFVLAIALLGTAAFLAAEAATMPARQRTHALRRAATYGRLRRTAREDGESFRSRVLIPLEQRLARVAFRLTPRASVDSIAAKLLAAGLGRAWTPQKFLAAKGGLAVSALLFGMFTGAISGSAGTSFALGFLFASVAFFVPDLVLRLKASRRREDIRAEIPDALDLLTVSVEAGMGFDGAIAKLTEHMDGPLAEEFALTLGQMRVGESRAEALKALAERVDAPEVAAFVRAIVQSDQLGMSLGRILKAQATDARNRRQAAAEERAMKAPIKMLFPTVLFIFPAMFVVVLGPAALNLMEMF